LPACRWSALTARARFALERFSDVYLVTWAVAAHVLSAGDLIGRRGERRAKRRAGAETQRSDRQTQLIDRREGQKLG
jgi:hypothetical protein